MKNYLLNIFYLIFSRYLKSMIFLNNQELHLYMKRDLDIVNLIEIMKDSIAFSVLQLLDIDYN